MMSESRGVELGMTEPRPLNNQYYCLEDLLKINPIDYQSLRYRVLQAYVEKVKVPESIYSKGIEEVRKFRYMLKAEKIFQIVSTSLSTIARAPRKESLPAFYGEIIDIASKGLYNTVIDEAVKAIKIISRLWKEYRSKILDSNRVSEAKTYSREFVGRVLSIVKRNVKHLYITKDIAKIVKETPCIDTSSPLFIIAGMPQVGKSTLVSRISSAKPKISPYPFTTKNVILGHLDLGSTRIQIMDTPGILDRPLSEMNDIERRAIAALRTLQSVVLYLIDPSIDAYYSIDQQIDVLRTVSTIVGKEKILVVFNKIDKVDGKRLDYCRKLLNSYGYDVDLEISALQGIGIDKLIIEALKRYDLLYKTSYSYSQ